MLQTPVQAADSALQSTEKSSSATTGGNERNQHLKRGLAPMLTWIDADSDPKAVLLCVHGLGLYNGSFEHFGKQMAPLGYATYAVDVRGFGSWQQSNGNRDVDFEDCLKDVHDTLRVIRRVHPDIPIFILGESMGGAIALRITSRYPELVDGLISAVPSGDRLRQRKTELKVALRLLKGAANKKFDVGSDVIDQASQGKGGKGQINEELRDKWRRDPLARLELSPNELIQFQHFMNENHDSAKLIKNRPVLMVQGLDDNLVKAEGTLDLWHELPTDDKEIQLIPQARHLIFEESEFNDQALNEKVKAIVTRWLDTHINKARKAVSPSSATQTRLEGSGGYNAPPNK